MDWVAMAPEGIHRRRHGHHPVLVLREVDGWRSIALRLDPPAVAFLSAEFAGRRSPRSRTYETVEALVRGLGEDVRAVALRLDPGRGRSGTVEARSELRRVRVRARPGDVAALAWHHRLPVLVPALAGDRPRGEGDRCSLVDREVWAFRRFLESVTPEDFCRGSAIPELGVDGLGWTTKPGERGRSSHPPRRRPVRRRLR